MESSGTTEHLRQGRPHGDALAHETRATLGALWSPLLAITTTHEGRPNGQIALAGLTSSILPDAPRILVGLWKANLTHDLVVASRVLAVHLLPDGPEQTHAETLELIHTLGLRSGRDSEKMSALAWRPGATGSPILAGALSYVEGRVVATLDADEMTLFLADVVGGERLREGQPLTWHTARKLMPAAWLDAYEANQAHQRSEARRLRGLAPG